MIGILFLDLVLVLVVEGPEEGEDHHFRLRLRRRLC